MPPFRFVTASDLPVRYAQAGDGPDVVLIHGAMTSAEDMVLGPFDALAERFRVTAFDRPGHGETHRPRLQGSLSQQTAIWRVAQSVL